MTATAIPKLLRRREVEAITGLSTASLYRLMSEGFPRPIRVGGRAVRWREDDIAAYLASRPTAGPGKPKRPRARSSAVQTAAATASTAEA